GRALGAVRDHPGLGAGHEGAVVPVRDELVAKAPEPGQHHESQPVTDPELDIAALLVGVVERQVRRSGGRGPADATAKQCCWFHVSRATPRPRPRWRAARPGAWPDAARRNGSGP